MTKFGLITGDLWDYHQRGDVIAITTGGLIAKNGACAMPRGCARQAADRYPQLPYILGQQIKFHGLHVFDLGQRIVAFPVECSPFENPEAKIIRQSCQELVELTDYKKWQRVILPRPGCGAGGMLWNDVKKILEPYLDSRFLIIEQQGETR
jgi:hypothetical protein